MERSCNVRSGARQVSRGQGGASANEPDRQPGGDDMESYIVRVRRSGQGSRESLDGQVEIVASQETKPFTTYRELWEILKERESNARGDGSARGDREGMN